MLKTTDARMQRHWVSGLNRVAEQQNPSHEKSLQKQAFFMGGSA
jgi:hypothetical protein